MKADSSSFRASSIQETITRVKAMDICVIVYEPMLKETELYHLRADNDLAESNALNSVLVTKRAVDDVRDAVQEVYTRYLLGAD